MSMFARAMDFSFSRVKGGYILSGEAGSSMFVPEKDFAAFGSGTLSPGKEKIFSEHGLLKDRLDMTAVVSGLRERYACAEQRPLIHIISVAKSCDHACAYCSASASGDGARMSIAAARKTLDFIFGLGASELMIELQGGEPLTSFGTAKFIIEEASRRARRAGIPLHLSIVTNLGAMTAPILDFLARNRVTVCTSLDGPARLHDLNRRRLDGRSGHRDVVYWLKKINAARKKYPGFEPPNAICTVTRSSLPYPKEIVDEFLASGLHRVQLGPMDPIGSAAKRWRDLGYTAAELLAFYSGALDYMLELNLKGTFVYEKGAMLFLKSMAGTPRSRYANMDFLRRLAYNVDGSIYSTDEGRMLSNAGDDFFKVGDVRRDTYASMTRTPAARAFIMSAFPALFQPKCARCAYSAYCRVLPVYNYAAQNSFWGDMAINERCAFYSGIFKLLFEKRRSPRYRAVLDRWAESGT